MARTNATAGDAAPPLTRCVILTQPPARRPDRLVNGLEQRKMQVLLVDDAPQVMLALAEADRQALIVNEPGRHGSRLAELLGAVRQYYPRTLCWQYDQDGRGLLPIGAAVATAEPVEPAEQAPPTRVNRERRQREALPQSPPPPPETARTTAPELTAEELEMLLGGDDDVDAQQDPPAEDEYRLDDLR